MGRPSTDDVYVAALAISDESWNAATGGSDSFDGDPRTLVDGYCIIANPRQTILCFKAGQFTRSIDYTAIAVARDTLVPGAAPGLYVAGLESQLPDFSSPQVAVYYGYADDPTSFHRMPSSIVNPPGPPVRMAPPKLFWDFDGLTVGVATHLISEPELVYVTYAKTTERDQWRPFNRAVFTPHRIGEQSPHRWRQVISDGQHVRHPPLLR